MADDIVKLALAVALQRGLARQVRNRNHPAESGFRTVLPDRDQSIWPVESASHDLDTGAVEAAEAQRRAAIPAKVALGDRGRAERGRLAAGPGEIALSDLGKRGKRRASGFLAHPAMADADLGRRRRQRKADRAALAAAGQNGFCNLSHAPTTSR